MKSCLVSPWLPTFATIRPVSYALAFLAPVTIGCSPAALAPAPPEIPSDQQARSVVRANPLEPLVIEWPASERAELEARLKEGLVVVHYDGRTMDVLTQCRAPGTYSFRSTTTHRDQIVIEDEHSLAAQLPLGAARLSAKLKQSGRLEVSLTVVGTFASENPAVRRNDLEGDCLEATHLVTSVAVGAFELRTGGAAQIGGGASVANVGADTEQGSRRETLSRAGDETACQKGSSASSGPPDGCGATLRLALAPLRSRSETPTPAESATSPSASSPAVSASAPPLPALPVPVSAPPPEATPSALKQDSLRLSPAAESRTETPPARPTSSAWPTILGVSALVLLAGLVLASQIVKKEEPKKEPAPTGGLGNVTLPTVLRW